MHVRVSGSSRHGARGWTNLLTKAEIGPPPSSPCDASEIVTRLGVDFVFLDATSVTAGGEYADPVLVTDAPGKSIQLNCLADATSAATGRSGPELGKKRRTFGLPN